MLPPCIYCKKESLFTTQIYYKTYSPKLFLQNNFKEIKNTLHSTPMSLKPLRFS